MPSSSQQAQQNDLMDSGAIEEEDDLLGEEEEENLFGDDVPFENPLESGQDFNSVHRPDHGDLLNPTSEEILEVYLFILSFS